MYYKHVYYYKFYFILDASPLENYHIAESFKVMSKQHNNILISFPSSEYRLIRRRIIESILSTDMAHHSKYVTSLKNKINIFELKNPDQVKNMILDNDKCK